MQEQASITAAGAAFCRYVESLRPDDDRICYDPYAVHFLSQDTLELIRRPDALKTALEMVDCAVPGYVCTVNARVRYFDDLVKKSLGEGVEQLVILGAGYDTRAYRIEGLKNIKVFEVDHPGTQNVKITKVKEIFGSLPGHVVYVPVDIETEKLAQKLTDGGYDRSKKTLFVMEGLLCYLSPEAVDETLSFIAGNSCKGSAIVFDLYSGWVFEDGEVGKIIRDNAAQRGEPLRFYIKGTIEDFLAYRGFSHISHVTAEEYMKVNCFGKNESRKVSDVLLFAHAVSQGGEEKRRLGVERIEYRSPFNYAIMVARVRGPVSTVSLTNAVKKAFVRHPLLRASITLEDDGTTWFMIHKEMEPEIHVENCNGESDWIARAIEEHKKFFLMDKGPLARIILLQSTGYSDIMIVCHHTICDGMSMIYLVRDILTYIGDPDVRIEQLPVPPVIGEDSMAAPANVDSPISAILENINLSWKNNRKLFREDEYGKLYRQFWEKTRVGIIFKSVDEDMMQALAARCKKENVTVNTAMCTAFLQAQYEVQGDARPYLSKVAIPINFRNKMSVSPGEGVGLFIASTSHMLVYQPGKPFWDLAREFNLRIKKTIAEYKPGVSSTRLVDPTLVDAIYFSLGGLLQDEAAAKFARMISFDKISFGLTVSNLGKADIPINYGPLQLDALFFVPPGMPMVEKMVGIVTANGKMSVSMIYNQSDITRDTMEEFGEHTMDSLFHALYEPMQERSINAENNKQH